VRLVLSSPRAQSQSVHLVEVCVVKQKNRKYRLIGAIVAGGLLVVIAGVALLIHLAGTPSSPPTPPVLSSAPAGTAQFGGPGATANPANPAASANPANPGGSPLTPPAASTAGSPRETPGPTAVVPTGPHATTRPAGTSRTPSRSPSPSPSPAPTTSPTCLLPLPLCL